MNSILLKKDFILKKLLPIFFGLILILFGIFLFLDSLYGGAVGNGNEKFDLLIESGDSSSKIANKLFKANLIRSISHFNFLMKITGSSSKLKQGLYLIDSSMSSRKIMEILVDGKVKMVTFTIPEGYNNRQIAEVLFAKKLITNKKDFFSFNEEKKFLTKFNIPANTTEGYLFPETYSVPYNYPQEKIIEMMIKRFFSILEKIPESKNITPEELHKKLILASIVEREAKIKEEQPLMAGVFTKRLAKGIALESCATVQYLFEKPKKRLFEKDLETPSLYNTYLHKGFPPGPISSPGLPALKAAFKPTETDSLFFLKKPDGSHYFSKNHKEHLDAKKKYIDVLYD